MYGNNNGFKCIKVLSKKYKYDESGQKLSVLLFYRNNRPPLSCTLEDYLKHSQKYNIRNKILV